MLLEFKRLYDNLLNLSSSNDAFYYVDQELDDIKYRIFLYRLASYSDFLLPDAKESRGITFRMSDGCPDELVCRPMQKFWNLYENPETMNLVFSKNSIFQDKADGSLISSFMHNNNLYLKSKGSLVSGQAVDALNWLKLDKNYKLYSQLEEITKNGFTVNLEWIGPSNRIVLGYPEDRLILLNIRNIKSGNYGDINELDEWHPDNIINSFIVNNPEEFIKTIPDMSEIEGYVVQYKSNNFVKIKTKEYVAKHHAKDSINSPRRLFEVCLREASDDLKIMFGNDSSALQLISEMEEYSYDEYNKLVKVVENFWNKNKHLNRKEYAILGQEVLADKGQFGLAMNKYLEKEFSYKEFMIKNWRNYVKDVDIETIE